MGCVNARTERRTWESVRVGCWSHPHSLLLLCYSAPAPPRRRPPSVGQFTFSPPADGIAFIDVYESNFPVGVDLFSMPAGGTGVGDLVEVAVPFRKRVYNDYASGTYARTIVGKSARSWQRCGWHWLPLRQSHRVFLQHPSPSVTLRVLLATLVYLVRVYWSGPAVASDRWQQPYPVLRHHLLHPRALSAGRRGPSARQHSYLRVYRELQAPSGSVR
jgi:hypothetical protein